MATALVTEFSIIGNDLNGNPTMRYFVALMDPTNTDPIKRFQILQPEVTLDATNPNQFVQQSRTAIINAAAALSPPIVLAPADVIQGMYT